MEYRKKPLIVEAFHLVDLSRKTIINALDFMGQKIEIPKGFPECNNPFEDYLHKCWKENGLTIHTLEGDVLASEGYYIIKGVAGEFYPCKPEIFEKTYEKVEQ